MAGISPKQGFYLALPILHGIAAIASLVICFYCNVRESSQQARVPVVLPIPSNFSGTLNKEIMYLAGFPWAEDAEFVTHTWNPFALIMTFQWLTAGFALRNVATLTWDGIISSAWCAWLVIGYTLYLAWSFAGFGGPVCVAMFATVTVSYIASLLLCLASVGPPGLGPRRRYDSVPTREPKEDALPVPSAASQAWTSTDGRLWCVCVYSHVTSTPFVEPSDHHHRHDPGFGAGSFPAPSSTSRARTTARWRTMWPGRRRPTSTTRCVGGSSTGTPSTVSRPRSCSSRSCAFSSSTRQHGTLFPPPSPQKKGCV